MEMIECRVYDRDVRCSVCTTQTKIIVFYSCMCGSIQVKICWLCRFFTINTCVLCSEREEEIFFFNFF